MKDTVAHLHEAALHLRQRAGAPVSRTGLALPPLVLVTDETRVPDPLPAIRGLPKGCGVLFRHYGAAGRAALAASVAAACREAGLILLVAEDAAIARAVAAEGLHLPERAIASGAPPAWEGLLTAAAHSPDAVARAVAAGADAVFVSPVFPTRSHPDSPALGPEAFAAIVRGARCPVYALGGIDASSVDRLRETGAAGIAATGALSGEA